MSSTIPPCAAGRVRIPRATVKNNGSKLVTASCVAGSVPPNRQTPTKPKANPRSFREIVANP